MTKCGLCGAKARFISSHVLGEHCTRTMTPEQKLDRLASERQARKECQVSLHALKIRATSAARWRGHNLSRWSNTRDDLRSNEPALHFNAEGRPTHYAGGLPQSCVDCVDPRAWARRCAHCDAPMYILVRGHHHSENGKDVT